MHIHPESIKITKCIANAPAFIRIFRSATPRFSLSHPAGDREVPRWQLWSKTAGK
jgi:hypothetical protein